MWSTAKIKGDFALSLCPHSNINAAIIRAIESHEEGVEELHQHIDRGRETKKSVREREKLFMLISTDCNAAFPRPNMARKAKRSGDILFLQKSKSET